MRTARSRSASRSLLAPATAQARVVVVAADRPEAALLDVGTNAIAAPRRAPRPRRVPWQRRRTARGRTSRPAAASRAIDLGTRKAVGTARLSGEATTVATSPDGARVYATRGRALDVIDAATMRPLAPMRLPRAARALAIAPDGTRAVVTFRGGAAVVDLTTRRVRRRVRIAGAGAIAFDDAGRAWISSLTRVRRRSAGRVVPVDPVSGALGRAIKLRRAQGGGGLAIRGRRAFVGAGDRRLRAAVVDLRRRRAIEAPRTGRGPGAPAWSSDGVRIYVADGGGATCPCSPRSPTSACAWCACAARGRSRSPSSPGSR